MKKMLMVEGSQFFGEMSLKKIKHVFDYSVIWTRTLAETQDVLNDKDQCFSVALLDYYLQDAPNGEILAEVEQHGIPSIVFTSDIDKTAREKVWKHAVVDYVLKSDPDSYSYLITQLKRLERNSEIKILVVDDTRLFRTIITDLLKVHQFKVLTASNGLEALTVVKENPDIKMVITDFSMPQMDGFHLTHNLRKQYGRDQLAIIGISSVGDQIMASQFIKQGANDFIVKQTLQAEEFYCRVNQNLDYLESIAFVKEIAIRDHLTGLYNRRYLFEAGEQLFANAERGNISLTCAIIDIDYFKKVNDTYGHKAGDIVLQKIAALIDDRLRMTDIVARFGGEEFCVLAVNMNEDKVNTVFGNLRAAIEAMPIAIDGDQSVSITISIGVTSSLDSSLDEMMKEADKLLYQAKAEGRNRVVTGEYCR